MTLPVLLKNISVKILLLAFVLTAFCVRSSADVHYQFQSSFFKMDPAIRIAAITELTIKHYKKPANPIFIRQLAEAYTATDQTDSALAYWSMLATLKGNDDTILFTEAQLYYAQKSFDTAATLVTNAIGIQPDDMSYQQLLAVIDYQLHKTDSALSICDKILSTSSDDVNSLMLSGLILRDQKQNDAAFERFDRCVKADPSNTEALIYRADEYVLLKKYNDALRDYSAARADLSENADILNNIGICYYQSGEYQKAIGFFKKAIAINSHLPQGYFNKGLSYYHLNHIDTASIDIKTASILWDSCHTDSCRAYFLDAMYYLGICYKKTGDLPAARACFEFLQKEKYAKDLTMEIKLIDYSLFISCNWYYFILLLCLTIGLIVVLVKMMIRN
jgi:tetratricopeptide (TPR) repeat protein